VSQFQALRIQLLDMSMTGRVMAPSGRTVADQFT